MDKPLILVVEDDSTVRNLISTTLRANDYKYITAATGRQALAEATSKAPGIILLDLGLPDMDGTEVINEIRGWANTPIIVISARSDVEDKIRALDTGADDYLTKPFSVEELLARLRVTERRLQAAGEAVKEEGLFINGDLKIDYSAGCVWMADEEIHLTPIEYKLLCLMARNQGKVLTHTYITKKVWGAGWENNVASLRVFMASLRKKIENTPTSPQYIQTHVGVGYRMNRV